LATFTSAFPASFLFTLPPPNPDRLLHVPPWLVSVFAVM
jgi:hypothetical protein